LLAELAAAARLPAIYPFRENVEAGGLMAYSEDGPELFRRAGSEIAAILDGAKPADIPVEQPSRFLLTINLKTARALGLDPPPSLLAAAEDVIE
jgi:putative ABC transport system substrate-binding protein